MHISIVTGGTTTQLSDSPSFIFSGSTVSVLGNNVTVTPDIAANIQPDTFIQTINGVSSNDDGEFFIDGSECDSWGIIENGVDSITHEQVTGVTASGISLVDLCPACRTCESIYRLQYEVENLKMWVNTLKDVNLYINDDMDQRRTNLGNLRVTNLSDLCAAGLEQDDAYMQIKSVQLLQQYMTVVHMWNYVVSQNNASNVIEVAPEDTAGFVVQTKRALPSCADNQAIQCTIDVGAPCGIKDDGTLITLDRETYPVSIYVPEPVLSLDNGGKDVQSLDLHFEPFDEKQEQALGNAKIHVRSQTQSDKVRVQTDVISAKVAGTYVVSAKFLPFIYYRIWKGSGSNKTYISVRGGTTVPITGTTVGDDTVWDFGISGHEVAPKLNPTAQDYLDAKTTPTSSVDFKLVWPIHIEWTVTGVAEPYVEDYNYIANGIRAYYGDAIISEAVIPNPVEQEPESAGT